MHAVLRDPLPALATGLSALALLLLLWLPAAAASAAPQSFHVEEATLGQIQAALRTKRVTTVNLVNRYLTRIRAYNGSCVRQPDGILGVATTIPDAGQLNALSTLNLRPATRRAWGFDDHKARSLTDTVDSDADMPDALEVAAAQDRQFAATGNLVGPLHGMVLAIKDQFDTRDLRTTSGADAPYANDRPPRDATFVERLRAAGAIILAKANMGEYASGDRSSFGGVFCNPYDTERSPGRSSGGSGSAVAANLVTCAVGEESGPSVRNPAKNNNVVGLAPTQELVSRAGMIRASLLNDRVGPLCRTVTDVAKLLDVMAGFDPRDELTAFAVGRQPAARYASFTSSRRLEGLRIGVVREFMNRELYTQADAQTIDIIEREIAVLKNLGATVVDPGPGGALFQTCVDRYREPLANGLGKPTSGTPTIRDIGADRDQGEGRYVLDAYLKERGDPVIRTTDDLVDKSTFYLDVREGTGFSDKKKSLRSKADERTLDPARRLQLRFTLQQVVLQCMAEQHLDAVTYPTGNVPAPKLGAPTEPSVNGRSPLAWTLLGANGFPTLSVPAGFTTEVFDRVADPATAGATRLVGPVPARLPVGLDFLGRPFTEAVLFRIAAAYEAATHHRASPAGFGPPSAAGR
jgi:Asp-tRNA(Asn)/Glu-tRNA(Gln) amidotransferase A subunit family amidase